MSVPDNALDSRGQFSRAANDKAACSNGVKRLAFRMGQNFLPGGNQPGYTSSTVIAPCSHTSTQLSQPQALILVYGFGIAIDQFVYIDGANIYAFSVAGTLVLVNCYFKAHFYLQLSFEK